MAVAVTCSQGGLREGHVEGLAACGAGRGGAERAAAAIQAAFCSRPPPGSPRSSLLPRRPPLPAPRAPRGPAAVTRQAAGGRLALRFVEPGDGRGLLTCSCESSSDRRWELLVEPGKVKVCSGSDKPGGPGARPQRLRALGLEAPCGLPPSGDGKRAVAARDTSAKASASASEKQLCLLQRGLLVVCTFLQLVVPGGRLRSDCFSRNARRCLWLPAGQGLPCPASRSQLCR